MNTSLKILLTLGILLVIGGAGLWINGGKKRTYETVLTIDASPDQVFPFLVETDYKKKWVDGLMDSEPLGEMVNMEGAENAVTFNANGKLVEFKEKVIRYTKDKMLSVRLNNSSVVSTSIYKLEEIDGVDGKQTQLRYTVKRVNCGIGRFFATFATDTTEDQINEDAISLKKLVESTATVSQPMQGFQETETIGAGG